MSFITDITDDKVKVKTLNIIDSFDLNHKSEIRVESGQWIKELGISEDAIGFDTRCLREVGKGIWDIGYDTPVETRKEFVNFVDNVCSSFTYDNPAAAPFIICDLIPKKAQHHEFIVSITTGNGNLQKYYSKFINGITSMYFSLLVKYYIALKTSDVSFRNTDLEDYITLLKLGIAWKFTTKSSGFISLYICGLNATFKSIIVSAVGNPGNLNELALIKSLKCNNSDVKAVCDQMILSYKNEVDIDKYNSRKIFVFSSKCSMPLNDDIRKKIIDVFERYTESFIRSLFDTPRTISFILDSNDLLYLQYEFPEYNHLVIGCDNRIINTLKKDNEYYIVVKTVQNADLPDDYTICGVNVTTGYKIIEFGKPTTTYTLVNDIDTSEN